MPDPSENYPARKSPRYGRRVLAVWVLIIAVVGGYQFYLSRQRPMFANHYGKNDRMFFNRWIQEPPITDRRGNALKADYPQNILVLFLMEDADYDVATFWFPVPTADGVFFLSADDVQFDVPRQSNTLVVFDSHGIRTEFTIADGTAERIHRSLYEPRNDIADLRLLVEDAVSTNDEQQLKMLLNTDSQP